MQLPDDECVLAKMRCAKVIPTTFRKFEWHVKNVTGWVSEESISKGQALHRALHQPHPDLQHEPQESCVCRRVTRHHDMMMMTSATDKKQKTESKPKVRWDDVEHWVFAKKKTN